EDSTAIDLDGGGVGEPAAGPLEDVHGAVRGHLAGVRRHARDGRGDVHDAVAVEVGDGQCDRNERDVVVVVEDDRGAGEGEIPVPQGVGIPLEDVDAAAGRLAAGIVLAEVTHDDVEHAVAGDVGQPDPGRVAVARRE